MIQVNFLRVFQVAFVFLLVVFSVSAQVDLRRVAVTPDQDLEILDSTQFTSELKSDIHTVILEGAFSGIVRIKGEVGISSITAYHVFQPQRVDKRAVGLREVSLGANDNTGVGLRIEQADGVLRISPGSDYFLKSRFLIIIPANYKVLVMGTGYGGLVELTDIKGEIKIERLMASVRIINPGDVVYVDTKQNIEVICSEFPKSRMQLTSQLGLIDFAVPDNSNIELEIVNTRVIPRIFSDLPVKMIYSEKNLQRYRLNDPSVPVRMSAPYGNIYLRKVGGERKN